jgi:hypothetical protein
MSDAQARLKACPFCGGEAFRSDGGTCFVGCSSSTQECPVSPTVRTFGNADAVTAWNTRTPDAQPSSTEPCLCVDFQRYVETCPEHGFVARRNETAPSSTDEVERVATALQSVQPYALSWSFAQSLARAAIAAMVTKP